MHPDPRERVAERPRLRELVLVVREDEVEPAAVDLELGPERFSAIAEHSMCQPGRPRPQGESHDVSSPGLFAFQSAKSRGSSLQRVRLLLLDLVGPLAGERAVLGEARDAEVDVALGLVGVARVDQLLDQRDDLGDRLGRLRLTSSGISSPKRSRVLEVPLRSPRAASSALAPGAAS